MLIERRERWSLTWRGKLLAASALVVLVVFGGRAIFGFLAISRPVGGQYLVVEGWMPVYAYREAAEEFRRRGYRAIIAAGALREVGDPDGKLHESFGSEYLVRFGVEGESIANAPFGGVQRDRTYHSALAVRNWIRSQHVGPTSVDVIALGPHARRTLLLYEAALGTSAIVGVITIRDRRYDDTRWWRNSEGLRTLIGESIAYVYALAFVYLPIEREVTPLV